MIEVYTDGSCLGNPGAGGWAFLIIRGDKLIFKSGSEINSTNNIQNNWLSENNVDVKF